MTRQDQFREELKALLGKYDVEISLEQVDFDTHMIEFYSKPESYEDNGTPINGIDFRCRYFDCESE